jgi:hypothetical protein
LETLDFLDKIKTSKSGNLYKKIYSKTATVEEKEIFAHKLG